MFVASRQIRDPCSAPFMPPLADLDPADLDPADLDSADLDPASGHRLTIQARCVVFKQRLVGLRVGV